MRRKHLADLTLFGVGFILVATANLFYNALLFSDPLQSPTRISGSGGTPEHLTISWLGFPMTGVRLANLIWIFPPVLLLGLFCKRYRPSPKARMYLALFLMNIGIYFFFTTAGGGPGPRFFLAYFPFLVLAMVDLYRWICRECPDARHLWRLGILCLLIANLAFAVREGYKIYVRRDLQRTEKRAGPGKKIFLLRSGTYPGYVRDLTRNPPDLSTAENLYFLWCAEPERDALLKRFPGRKIFVYEYPGLLRPYVP